LVISASPVKVALYALQVFIVGIADQAGSSALKFRIEKRGPHPGRPSQK
jgi:hypothetical protein